MNAKSNVQNNKGNILEVVFKKNETKFRIVTHSFGNFYRKVIYQSLDPPKRHITFGLPLILLHRNIHLLMSKLDIK